MSSTLALCVLVVCLSFAMVIKCDCTYLASDGTSYYDLSPLTVTDGSSYYAINQSNNNNRYWYNICGDISGACPTAAPGSAGCQNSFGAVGSIGLLSTQTFSDGENGAATGVTISYTGGSGCGSQGDRRSFVHLNCGTAFAVVDGLVESPVCTYTITISSIFACPLAVSCENSCTGGQSCCDDKTVGKQCYDPAVYRCSYNPAGGSTLCPVYAAGACGAACYDPKEYCCISNVLTQIEYC